VTSDRISTPPAGLRESLRRAAAGTDDPLVSRWLLALADRGEAATLDAEPPPGERAAAAKVDGNR
jgi:hypothetical protein